MHRGGMKSVAMLDNRDAGRQTPGPSQAAKLAALSTGRLAREWDTVSAMVHCYCSAHHQGGRELCPECQGLLDYATVRLERCRFGPEKPTCARCPVHCYQRQRREEIRVVMRYAGPRLLWRHPWLSLRHWLDGFRPVSQS